MSSWSTQLLDPDYAFILRPSDERLKLVAMRFGFPLNASAVATSLIGCRSRDVFNPNDGVNDWLLPLFVSLLRAYGSDCGLASTPLVRSGALLPATIPDPMGIDDAIRLSGRATPVACDSTAVESKALLGGPARCDAAAAGGPSTGAEAMFFVAAGETGTVYAGCGLATALGASTGRGNLPPDSEPVSAVIFGNVAMLGTFGT